MPEQQSAPITGVTHTGKIIIAGLGVVAVLAVVAARQSPPAADATPVAAQPQRTAAMDLDLTAKTTAAKPKRAPARARTTQTAASKPAASKPAAVTPAAHAPVASTRVVAAAAALPAEPVSNVVLQESTATTITGCLEDADGTFRLKETSGADAPKSRSWKSGFLRKSSASIWVVDAANNGLRLPTHVGERVSLTGVLADREMQARSLQRVPGESCD